DRNVSDSNWYARYHRDSQRSKLEAYVQIIHQSITTLHHVKPPPNDAIKTMSSFFTRPLSTHSSNPIGIDADEVFPCCAMFEKTFDSSTFSAFATASVILWLA